jgi:uncharacterized membrane protein
MDLRWRRPRSGDFAASLIHLYRAEVSRTNTWRIRLDTTTNWAVVTTGAAVTFTFSNPLNTHVVIIMDTLLTLLFLLIEARRYRYYELWSHRVRLLENNMFARMLVPGLPTHPPDWLDELAESLRHPRFTISLSEAVGRRYRRNYAPLFWLLAMGWILKIVIHPFPAYDWQTFLERASMGPVPGSVMIGIGIAFHVVLNLFGLLTVQMRQSQGEVFTEVDDARPFARFLGRFRQATWEAFEVDTAAFNLRRPDKDQLMYIITDKPEPIAQAITQELGRGLTRLDGTGVYTGKAHTVLLCVYQSSEVGRLKRIIKRIDNDAFIVIHDVKNVHGRGFSPLET